MSNSIQEHILHVDLREPDAMQTQHSTRQLLQLQNQPFSQCMLWQKIISPVRDKSHDHHLCCELDGEGWFVEVTRLDQHHIHVLLTQRIQPSTYIKQLLDILDNLGAYVFIKDLNFRYVYANKIVGELFNLTLSQIIGRCDDHFFGEHSGRDIRENSDRQVLEKGVSVEREEHIFVPIFNEVRIYKAVKKPIFDEQGNVIGLYGISTDITDVIRARQRAADSERKLSTILNNVGAYIYSKDEQLRFTYVNQKTADLFGQPIEHILGKSNHQVLGIEQGEHFADSDRLVFSHQQTITSLETMQTPQGERYYWSVKVPMLNDDNQVYALQGMSTDITEQKRLEQQQQQANQALKQQLDEITKLKDQLAYKANHDGLTDLFNRQYFNGLAEKAMAQALRHGHSLCFVIIDIDHFKQVNDVHGHQAGDRCLQLLASMLKQQFRNEDIVCRYGGEEFALMLSFTDAQCAFQRIEQLREQFAQQNLGGDDAEIYCTLSAGLATFPVKGDNLQLIMHAADMALYQAKQQARNLCVIAS